MKVKCVRAKVEPPRNSEQRGLFFTADTEFSVSQGTEYAAWGVAQYKGGLIILIQDDNSQPEWYPGELFEIVDGAVPPDWHLQLDNSAGATFQMIMGFDELVNDSTYNDLLMEGDPDKVGDFQRRVEEAA